MSNDTVWKSYKDFIIKIEPAAEGLYRAEAEGPYGEAEINFKLPFDEKDLKIFLLEVGQPRKALVRGRAPEPMDQTVDFGSRLYDTVISGGLRDVFIAARREAELSGAGMRLRLRLADVPELANLPWEFLYDGRDFLALTDVTPIVRYLDLPNPPQSMTVELPLRILVTISAPHDQMAIDVDLERSKMQESLSGLLATQRVQVDYTPEATLTSLERTLRRAKAAGRPYHVWHYIGHGAYDPNQKGSVLLFCDENGMSAPVGGFQIGTLFSTYRKTRLALLNACEGARTDQDDPFAGVATALVERGVPAVIGMQFEISDQAAISFSGEFYAALVDGLPIDSALTAARRAIFFLPNWVEWATPVLYMRSQDGRLFDVRAPLETKPETEKEPEPVIEPVAPVEVQPEIALEDHPETPPERTPTSAPAVTPPPDSAPVPARTDERPPQPARSQDAGVVTREPIPIPLPTEQPTTGSRIPTWTRWLAGVFAVGLLVVGIFAVVGNLSSNRTTATPAAVLPSPTILPATPQELAPTEAAPVVVQSTPTPTQAPNPPLAPISPANVSQVVQVGVLGRGTVTGASLSPDGTRLAIAGGLGVWLYSLASPENPQLLDQHTDWVRAVAWSSDGTRLASASDDRTVRVWDAASGSQLRTLVGHTSRVRSVSWSPDGRQLASSGNDGKVRIWDAQSGRELATLESGSNVVWSVAWSPSGNLLAWGGANGVVRLQAWDGSTAGSVRTLSGHSGNVWGVVWSNDGTRLASQAEDGTVRVWDANTGQERGVLEAAGSWAGNLGWIPSRQLISWSFAAGQFIIIDAATGRELISIAGYTDWINALAYSPDSAQIAGGVLDGTIRIWETETGRQLRILVGAAGSVDSVAWSPDGSLLAAAGADGNLRIWERGSWTEPVIVHSSGGSVFSMDWAPDGGSLVVADRGGVWIWSASGEPQAELAVDPGSDVRTIAWSPDGLRIAAGSQSGSVGIYDTVQKRLQAFSGHDEEVTGVAWSADGSRLASSSLDGVLRIWDATSGALVTAIEAQNPLNAVAWSIDGALLAVASSDGNDGFVQILDTGTWNVRRDLGGHNSLMTSLAWSPDGRLLASGSRDGTIRLWGGAHGLGTGRCRPAQ